MSAWLNAFGCKHYNLNCPYRPTKAPTPPPAPIYPYVPGGVPNEMNPYGQLPDQIGFVGYMLIVIAILLAANLLFFMLYWYYTCGPPSRTAQQHNDGGAEESVLNTTKISSVS